MFTDKEKTQYKSTYQLLSEIADIYHDLTDKQQASLLETLAGKRGGQVLAGLLEDFSEVDRAMEEMSNAAGASEKEMDVIEQSWDYKANKLKETWVGVAQDLVNRGTVGNFIDSLTRMSDALATIIEKFADLKVLLPALAVGFATFKGVPFFNLRATFGSIDKLKSQLNALNQIDFSSASSNPIQAMRIDKQIKAIANGNNVIQSYGESLKKAGQNGKASMLGLGQSIATVSLKTKALEMVTATAGMVMQTAFSIGISLAISGIVSYIMKQVHATEELRQSSKALADTYQEETDSLNEQKAKYEELSAKLHDANTSTADARSIKEQLIGIQQDLNEKYGDEASHLNLVNGEYEEQIALLNQLSASKADKIVSQNSKAYDDANNYLNKERSYSFGSGISKEMYGDFAKYIKERSKYLDVKDSLGSDPNFQTIDITLKANIENADEAMTELYKYIEEYEKTHEVDMSFFTDKISEYQTKIANDEALKEYQQIRKQQVQALIARDDDLSQPYEHGLKAVEEYNKAIANNEGVEEARKNYEAFFVKQLNSIKFDDNNVKDAFYAILDGVDQLEVARQQLNQDWDKGILPSNGIESAEQSATKLQHLVDTIQGANLEDIDLLDNFDNQSDEVKNAFNTLAEGFGLSKEQAQLLVEKLVEIGAVGGDSANQVGSALDKAFSPKNFAETIGEFKNLTSLYTNWKQQVENEPTKIAVDISEIEGLREKWTEIVGDKAFNDFEMKVGSAQNIEQVNNAFQSLANTYVQQSGLLKQVTADNAQLIQTQLEGIGVTNADVLVKEQLEMQERDLTEAKQLEIAQAMLVSGATAEEIFANEELIGSNERVKLSIFELVMAQNIFNGTGIDVSGKVAQLQTLAGAFLGTANAALVSAKAASLQTQAEHYGLTGDNAERFINSGLTSYLDDLKNKTSDCTVNFNKLGGSAKGAGGGMKDAAKDAKEAADALSEVNSEIDALQDAYTKLEAIQKKYNKDGKITVDQAQEISQMDLRYLANLKLEAGQLKINTKAYQGMAKAKITELKIAMMRKAIDTINSIKSEADAELFLANANLTLAGTSFAVTEAEYNEALAHLQSAGAKQAEAAATIQLAMANAFAMMENIDFSSINTAMEEAGSDMGNAMGENMEEAFEEVIDWIERRIEILDKEIERLEAKHDNTAITNLTKRNKLIDKEMKIRNKEYKTYQQASKYYKGQFNMATEGLDAQTINKIKNGSIEVATITDEALSKAITKAKDFYDKMQDAKVNVQKMVKEMATLAKQKFDNIVEAFNIKIDHNTFSSDLIQAYRDLSEAKGEFMSPVYYESLATTAGEEVNLYTQKRQELINNLQRSLDKKKIKIGSEEYNEMQNEINECTKAIVEAQKAQVEWNKETINARNELFKLKQELISNQTSELDDIISLFDTEHLYDDDGAMTKEGLAKLGLYFEKYNAARLQAQQYAEQMDVLHERYKRGEISAKEYNEQLAETSSQQRNASKTAVETKRAINDLTKQGVEDQKKHLQELTDSYKDLIQSMKDALDSEKDLHDYEKSIAESNKNISKVKRQLAAMQNDNSASAIAKRKKLEAQLADYQDDLQSKQYDHSIQMQKKALDEEYDTYKKQLDKQSQDLEQSLVETELAFETALSIVQENSIVIGQTIATTAEEHGMQISNNIVQAWTNGKGALDAYADSLKNLQTIQQAQVEADKAKQQASVQQAAADSQNVDKSQKAKDKEAYDKAITDMANAIQAQDYAKQERKKYEKGSSKYKKHDDKLKYYKQVEKDAQQIIEDYERKYYNGMTLSHGFSYKLKDGKVPKPSKYATGVHNLRDDEWAWTQEQGDEAILSPSRNAVFTPLKAGDSVLTKAQTDNLFKLSKLNINDFLTKITRQKIASVPMVNNQSSNILNIENLVTVNGSIDNTNIKKMQETAKNAVYEAFRKLSAGLH